MKAFLMFSNKDFNPQTPLPANTPDLLSDLEISTLLNAMAKGDKYIYEICKTAFLTNLQDTDEIKYRQEIMQDCLNNPEVIRAIYQIPLDAIEQKHHSWLGIFTRTPSSVLSSAVEMMSMFVGLLKGLKKIADDNKGKFKSEGFTRFFSMIQSELDDEYFATVEYHLWQLKFREGVLISADLGKGNEGINYTLRLPKSKYRNWIKEFFSKKSPVYSFVIHPRDEAGIRILGDIKDLGVNSAANSLAQASEHIESFLNMLRSELAFYIGCINLWQQLEKLEMPITFPTPLSINETEYSFKNMYDISLALTKKQAVIGNDLNANASRLIIITGANQGGKSTFLRSVGLAQFMMQAGMYVPATSFVAPICHSIFTHYRRKEDESMESGKLDEELLRMSLIVDQINPKSLILFNESFAATNEREGSEIAYQITSALIERKVKVVFVTHMYEFARIFYEKHLNGVYFLRAERKSSGRRTFKLIEGEPLPTSFGEDVFNSVFQKKDESTINIQVTSINNPKTI